MGPLNASGSICGEIARSHGSDSITVRLRSKSFKAAGYLLADQTIHRLHLFFMRRNRSYLCRTRWHRTGRLQVGLHPPRTSACWQRVIADEVTYPCSPRL